MAFDPAMRTEAYELYLLGKGPGEIAAEMKRRHPDTDTPSAKTLENWAYVPDASGQTWSERRYAAEAEAMGSATRNFIGAKGKLVEGMLRIMQLQQARVERGYEAEGDTPPANLSQEVYALVNVTSKVEKMLDSRLAEEARRKDAIDHLISACREVVPNWDTLEPRIRETFTKLVAAAAAQN